VAGVGVAAAVVVIGVDEVPPAGGVDPDELLGVCTEMPHDEMTRAIPARKRGRRARFLMGKEW
jgi:hypothetical protein